jgi:hypothetical protein
VFVASICFRQNNNCASIKLKGAIWCRRSKNDNQYNDQKKNDKRGNIRLPLLSFFFWSLYWLSFFDLRHQIAPLVIFLLVIVLVVILWPTASDYPSCHFSFGHCTLQWPKEKWQEGQSDVVGQRMTTNTMTKRKMTKGAIWCHRSKNDNQYNDQKKYDKRGNLMS